MTWDMDLYRILLTISWYARVSMHLYVPVCSSVFRKLPLQHRFFPDIPWAHEQASTMMFDNMVDENNIDISRSDINFIHELIDPKRNVATQSRKFLYDVVSNSRNSVDVDKFDYLSRDCYYLGMKSFFDSDRLIRMARVVNDEICYPAKHAFSMYQLFYTRYSLHKTVYSHKVAQAIEFMIMDALLEADPVFGISKSVSDPEAYLHMTDAVVSRIEFSTDPSLQRSRQILKDINLRKLYKVAGETVMTYADGQRLGVISEVDITSRQPANGLLVPDRIIVQKFHLDFAMKNGNPLSRVSFFNSSDPDTSFKMEKSSISSIIPDMFSECILRVYVKDATDWNMECARIALAKFGRDHGLPSPGPCHSRASTPAKQVSFARPLDKLSSTKLNFGEKRRRGLDADDFPHSDA
uniref:HD-associated domain-containing protein n=1 Tax=Spongospora subterranea TaxID=70186 RepID=A0A0H5R6I4_9EUKA|eukprot:CRZ09377.1 hypothetical protein [Spongospora subterranea]